MIHVIDFRFPEVIGKTGGQDGHAQVFFFGDGDSFPVKEGTVSFGGVEHFVQEGDIDDADVGLPFPVESDTHRKNGEGSGEIGGAVQGVDEPEEVFIFLDVQVFFGQDGVVGEISFNHFVDEVLAVEVVLGYQVDFAFEIGIGAGERAVVFF